MVFVGPNQRVGMEKGNPLNLKAMLYCFIQIYLQAVA